MRLSWFLLLFFPTVVWASSNWKPSSSLDLELNSIVSPANISPQVDEVDVAGHAHGQFGLRYKRDFRIKVSPDVQWEPENASPTERFFYDLPEGYASYQAGRFTFQGGYNTFTWGATDGYNPLDVVNAHRYFDPLRSQKLGAPSLVTRVDMTKASFEAIYIPWQRKSVLPGVNSRWLPRDIVKTRSSAAGDDAATILLQQDVAYSYLPEVELNQALANNYGFRLQGQLPKLDLQAVYFEGAAPTPGTQLSVTANLVQFSPLVLQQTGPIAIIPVYYRQRVYGASAAWALGEVILRGETAITRTISKADYLAGNAQEYVLGIEKNINIGSQSVTALLQGTYAKHSDPTDNFSTSLARMFDRALMLAGRWAPSEKWTFLGSGIWDTEYHGTYFHGDGSVNLSDAWKAGLGFDLLGGPVGTPLGTYNRNDRITGFVRFQI